MISEKLISSFFSHFPFFSKSVHPLISILLWEVHNEDRNVLSKFQIDPVNRLGEMAKTSSGPVKIQQQQLEGCRSECGNELLQHASGQRTPAQGKQQKSSSQATCNHKNQCMQQMTGHSSHSTSRYMTETHSSDCINVI